MIYYRDKKTGMVSALKKYAGEKLINKQPEGEGLIIIYWLGGKRKYPKIKGKGKAKSRITYIGEWEYFKPIPYNLAKKINYKIINDEIIMKKITDKKDILTNFALNCIDLYSGKKLSDELKEGIKEEFIDLYNELRKLIIEPADSPKIYDSKILKKQDITKKIKAQDKWDEYIHGT